MNLPILYKRSSTGAIQQWAIFCDGSQFWTESGQLNGVITKTKPTNCFEKNVGRLNSTTAAEQAVVEARAKWDKKAKSGYVQNVADIDSVGFLEPMLAKKMADRVDKIDFSAGVLVQCKFNGVRCVITSDGAFSRTGERWTTIPHILESLQEFFIQNPNAYLDGELFNDDLKQNLNELISVVKKKNLSPECVQKSKEIVRFYCYDGYGFQTKNDGMIVADVSYGIRKLYLDGMLKKTPFVCLVKTEVIWDNAELFSIFDRYIQAGHEGVILRFLRSPYEHKRSSNLLKLKPEDDDEAKVINIVEGAGDWANTVKIWTLEWHGKTFNANMMGTMEEGVAVLKNRHLWLERTVSFKYNGLTGLGIPNFARVDVKNCFKGDRLSL